MKLLNLILAGGVVLIQSAAIAFGGGAKTVDLSPAQWVTANPPTSEQLVGKVHVVEFWATWCPPCVQQIPHIKSLAKKYEARNVIFIGLSEDRSINDVRKFVEKKQINYHIAMANGIGDKLGVDGIPTAFVIGHEGKIIWSGHPADARFERTIESAVTAMAKAAEANKKAIAKAG